MHRSAIEIKTEWDGKSLVETVLSENIPRRTEEDNKSFIDFGKAYTFNVKDISFLDNTTLREIARNLQIDLKDERRAILVEEIKKYDPFVNRPYVAGLSNVVLLHDLNPTMRFTLYREGQIKYVEYRDNKGNIETRIYYDNGRMSFAETWGNDGILIERTYYDKDENFNGPRFSDYRRRTSIYVNGEIRYYVHGKEVGRRGWMEYVEKRRAAIKEAAAMVTGVDSLINSYTNLF